MKKKEAICENCGHPAREHTSGGCMFIFYKDEALKECSCTLTEQQVRNQKSNQS